MTNEKIQTNASLPGEVTLNFILPVGSIIFLRKTGSGMHSDLKFGQRGACVCYIDAK
jgi:hypothetical protein